MNGKELKRMTSRFSAASSTYDRAVRVQPIVVEKVYRMLGAIGTPDRILEMGCGTGMLTEKLVARFPDAVIDAVDISEKMISMARRRLAGVNGSIRWLVSDMSRLRPPASYPLIVSSSALHWIIPVESGMKALARLLEAGGCAVFGLMVHGTLDELRAARERAAPRKPLLAGLPGVAAVRAALHHAGVKICMEQEEKIVINYPSAAALLKGLHDQGVTGWGGDSSGARLNKSELQNLVKNYDAAYRDGQGVRATYRVAYFKVSA